MHEGTVSCVYVLSSDPLEEDPLAGGLRSRKNAPATFSNNSRSKGCILIILSLGPFRIRLAVLNDGLQIDTDNCRDHCCLTTVADSSGLRWSQKPKKFEPKPSQHASSPTFSATEQPRLKGNLILFPTSLHLGPT